MINKRELQAEITRKGWTQKEFAEFLGISVCSANQKINGKPRANGKTAVFNAIEIQKMIDLFGKDAIDRIFF